MANFWFLAGEPKSREPNRGNMLYPRKCSRSYEKSPRHKAPNLRQNGQPKLINVRLYVDVAPAGGQGFPQEPVEQDRLVGGPRCVPVHSLPAADLEQRFLQFA